MAGVTSGGKWGFIDNTGKEVIPLNYDKVDSFSEGLAGVKSGGFIDKSGQVVIPIEYNYVGFFYEGASKVNLNGRTFSIDNTGKEI